MWSMQICICFVCAHVCVCGGEGSFSTQSLSRKVIHSYAVHDSFTGRACACVHEERLGNIFREPRKSGSHPGLNRGPLTFSALPPELWVTASPHNSQYHSTCAIRIPLGIDQ